MLERFTDDKYSPQNALQDLYKHRKKARINDGAMQVMQTPYNFYHKYAHLTKLALAFPLIHIPANGGLRVCNSQAFRSFKSLVRPEISN